MDSEEVCALLPGYRREDTLVLLVPPFSDEGAVEDGTRMVHSAEEVHSLVPFEALQASAAANRPTQNAISTVAYWPASREMAPFRKAAFRI